MVLCLPLFSATPRIASLLPAPRFLHLGNGLALASSSTSEPGGWSGHASVTRASGESSPALPLPSLHFFIPLSLSLRFSLSAPLCLPPPPPAGPRCLRGGSYGVPGSGELSRPDQTPGINALAPGQLAPAGATQLNPHIHTALLWAAGGWTPIPRCTEANTGVSSTFHARVRRGQRGARPR